MSLTGLHLENKNTFERFASMYGLRLTFENLKSHMNLLDKD